MGLRTRRENISITNHFYISSLSVSSATIITHPIDVVKVWMQIERQTAASKDAFSMRQFMAYYPKIYEQHGIKAFYSGIGAALFRAVTYGGVRLGLFDPLHASITLFPDAINVLAASLCSGCLASFIGNPFEVIKVRMQSNVDQYPNMIRAIHCMLRDEGMLIFWRGLVPSMTRSALLTASQIGPYSWSKKLIGSKISNNLNDRNEQSIGVHLGASLIAGIVSTTVTSPADVIKTRIMNRYRNQKTHIIQFGKDMLQQEGVMSLFRGWTANYVRLGPQTVAIFLFYEQYCKWFNVDSL